VSRQLRLPVARAEWAGLAAICIVALLLRLPVVSLPLERDEGEYAYTAQRWMQGDLPYRDSFDQKFPAIFVAYALIERLVGTSPAALHWGAQLYTLGTLGLLFLLGRQLSSSAGGLAAAAFAAFMTTSPGPWGNAANTELFMILPLTAAMLAACRAVEYESPLWAFATGALAAAALLFKQMAITDAVFYAAFVIWSMRRRALGAAMLGLGSVALLAPVVVYFAARGALDTFYDATIGYNLHYASRAALADYPRHFWPNWMIVCRSFWPFLVLALVPIARCISARPPVRRRTILVLLWLAASLAGTVSGGYFHPHYFMQVVPALATLGGMAARDTMFRQLRAPRRQLAQAVLIGAAIGAGVLTNAWYYLPGDADAKMFRLYGYTPFADSPAVARYIREHSEPNDTVLILGSEAQILYYAERKSATRYFYIYPLAGPYPNVRDRQAAALREVARNRPRFVVTIFLPTSFLGAADTPRDIIDGVREMLDQSYQVVGAVGYTQGEKTAFVTGEAAAEAWQRAPVWYGTPSWCALAVWERA